MQTQTCKHCKLTKDVSLFNRGTNKSGYSYLCKECNKQVILKWRKDNPEKFKAQAKRTRTRHNNKYKGTQKQHTTYRSAHLKNKFGITLEVYNNMLAKQQGVCWICNKPETSKRNKHLAVDHCHKTNKIRGLLCSMCNTGIESFRDNPCFIGNAIIYLKLHN